MSHKSVYAIATSQPQAVRIVDNLTASGFSGNDISVHTVNGEEVNRAEEILKNAGAEDISSTSISDAKAHS